MSNRRDTPEKRSKHCADQKRYYRKHLEDRKIYNQKYYMKNKVGLSQYMREWVKKRIVIDPDYEKKRWQKGKEKYRAQKRIYKVENLRFLCYMKGMNSPECERCGYNKCFAALDGHHLNPLQKEKRDDRLSKWIQYSPKIFQEKIKRVDMLLLCRNCHAELHDLEREDRI